MYASIFDLDQTLVDSSSCEFLRKQRLWKEVYKKIPNLIPYPNINKIFDLLHSKNIKIAIVTSSPSTYCHQIISHFRWKIDACVCYHDTALKKPYPDPIILALNKLKVESKNVVSFGDSDIDIIASKRAGVKTGACLWGSKDGDKLINSNPDYFFKEPIELFNFINNI